MLQPFFYAFRPLIVRPLPPSTLEIINVIIQLTFDFAIVYFLGESNVLLLLYNVEPFTFYLLTGSHPVTFVDECRCQVIGLSSRRYLACHGYPSSGRPLHLGTLHVLQRLRNLFLLWTFELDHVQRRLSQRASWFPSCAWISFAPGASLTAKIVSFSFVCCVNHHSLSCPADSVGESDCVRVLRQLASS